MRDAGARVTVYAGDGFTVYQDDRDTSPKAPLLADFFRAGEGVRAHRVKLTTGVIQSVKLAAQLAGEQDVLKAREQLLPTYETLSLWRNPVGQPSLF